MYFIINKETSSIDAYYLIAYDLGDYHFDHLIEDVYYSSDFDVLAELIHGKSDRYVHLQLNDQNDNLLNHMQLNNKRLYYSFLYLL